MLAFAVICLGVAALAQSYLIDRLTKRLEVLEERHETKTQGM